MPCDPKICNPNDACKLLPAKKRTGCGEHLTKQLVDECGKPVRYNWSASMAYVSPAQVCRNARYCSRPLNVVFGKTKHTHGSASSGCRCH